MANVVQLADLNVTEWRKLLDTLWKIDPGPIGATAVAMLVASNEANLRTLLSTLSDDLQVQRAIGPVRKELAEITKRLHSSTTDYMLSTMQDATQDPSVRAAAAAAIYAMLVTGIAGRRGEGITMASLWNQAVAAASLDRIQHEAIRTLVGPPIPTPAGVSEYATSNIRDWLTTAEHAVETAAPGEDPTLRDKVVGALEGAKSNIADYISQAIARAKLLIGIGVMVIGGLLLWLWLRK